MFRRKHYQALEEEKNNLENRNKQLLEIALEQIHDDNVAVADKIVRVYHAEEAYNTKLQAPPYRTESRSLRDIVLESISETQTRALVPKRELSLEMIASGTTQNIYLETAKEAVKRTTKTIGLFLYDVVSAPLYSILPASIQERIDKRNATSGLKKTINGIVGTFYDTTFFTAGAYYFLSHGLDPGPTMALTSITFLMSALFSTVHKIFTSKDKATPPSMIIDLPATIMHYVQESLGKIKQETIKRMDEENERLRLKSPMEISALPPSAQEFWSSPESSAEQLMPPENNRR